MQQSPRVDERVELAQASQKVKLLEVVAKGMGGDVPIQEPHRLFAGVAEGVDGARGNSESFLGTEVAPTLAVEDPQVSLDHGELVRLARMEVPWGPPALCLEYELDVEGLRGRLGRYLHDPSPHPEPGPEVQVIALAQHRLNPGPLPDPS